MNEELEATLRILSIEELKRHKLGINLIDIQAFIFFKIKEFYTLSMFYTVFNKLLEDNVVEMIEKDDSPSFCRYKLKEV